MLYTNTTVDDGYPLFETPRENNHSDTTTSPQVMLEYNALQCKQNNTTHTTGHKIPPSGNEYLCFKNYWKKVSFMGIE